jgi:hypothetical protein
MRKTFASTCVTCLLIATSSVFAQFYLPAFTITPSAPKSTDSISIKIDGYVPGPCYSDPSVQYNLQSTTSLTYINITLNSATICPPQGGARAFSATINVGTLPPGPYVASMTHYVDSTKLLSEGIQSFSVDSAVPVVPAPTSLILAAIGLAGAWLYLVLRRRLTLHRIE